MAGTIGIDSTAGLGTSSRDSSDEQQATIDGTYTYIALADEVVSEVGLHVGGSIGDGSGVELAVLDITGGISGAPLITSGTLTNLTAASRNALSITPVVLTEGNEYTVNWRVLSATPVSFFNTFTSNATARSTLDGTVALSDPFSFSSNISQRYAVFATAIAAPAGPTVTTPATGVNSTNIQSTGVDCDTITSSSLSTTVGGFSIALNITAQTTTTINEDFESGANDATLGSPVAGVPMTPTLFAIGTTAYQLRHEVTDGVDPNSINFDLAVDANHDLIQAMIATSNTTDGLSIFATEIITVEDDMQAKVIKVSGASTFTWSSDGTFLVNTTDTVVLSVDYFAPSTGEWSTAQITVSDGVIVPGGGMKQAMKQTMKQSMKQSMRIG